MKALTIAGAFVIASGCTPALKTVVNGTVDGHSLGSPIAVTVGTVVIISDIPGYCADVMAGTAPQQGTLLTIGIPDNPHGSSFVGTYDITPPSSTLAANSAVAVFEQAEGDCQVTTDAPATSGFVHVTASDLHLTSGGTTSGSLEGTFDLYFGTDHLTGSFNAPWCSPPLVSADGGVMPACL